MRKIENDCVDCDEPFRQGCVGCNRKERIHVYCDNCGHELSKVYVYGDYELCRDCVLEALEEDEIITITDL